MVFALYCLFFNSPPSPTHLFSHLQNSNYKSFFCSKAQKWKYIIHPLISSIPPIVLKSGLSKIAAAPIKILSFSNNLEIPPGAEVKATLLTGATNGLIKARLTEPLKVDGTSFLDAGTLLMGQGRSTVDRLYVDFKKAVFKDGKSIPISAQAFDGGDSILGLKGSRVGDISLKLAASAGLNFISGVAIGFQE